MCRFPSPPMVAAVIGSYPHAPPEGSAMQRAGPARGPVRPYAPWGMLAAIDLHGCESSRLGDADSIRAFVAAVIDAIGMIAHGASAPRALRRGRARGLVGDAVHRDQLDHDPRRRVLGPLLHRCVLLPAVRPRRGGGGCRLALRRQAEAAGASAMTARRAAIKTNRPTPPRRRRALSAWMITLAATAASTYALDGVATAAGVLLVASRTRCAGRGERRRGWLSPAARSLRQDAGAPREARAGGIPGARLSRTGLAAPSP
jgi:hypothetical protein